MSFLQSVRPHHPWIALAVAALAYVLSFFQRFAPAGIAHDLAAAFQTSAASLGMLAAAYFYIYTLMQIPTGILVDTLGPRRVLLVGGVVGAIGSLLFGLAPSFETAFVGRTLVGLGVSVTFISMLKIVALQFDEHRFATITGVAMFVGNLGSVLAGTPLNSLAQSVGWRSVFAGVAVISLVLAIAAWFLVRDDRGGEAVKARRFDRTVVLQNLWAVLRNRQTWPAAFVVTGVSGSFFAFAGLWAVPYLTEARGLEAHLAAGHLSLYFAMFALGCLLIGSVSDFLGRRKPVMIAATHVYVLAWLVLLFAPDFPAWLSYCLFAVMGLSTASFTLSWACAKEVNPPQLSGMSTSVANMGGFLAGALLQPVVGWAMDLSWVGTTRNGLRVYAPEDFDMGMGLMALVASVGALATWFLRETGCRNVWRPI